MALKQISINFDEELLVDVDNFIKSRHMSRATFVDMCVRQYLDSQNIMSNMGTMSNVLVNFFKNGKISDDELKQLEDFEVICNNFSKRM